MAVGPCSVVSAASPAARSALVVHLVQDDGAVPVFPRIGDVQVLARPIPRRPGRAIFGRVRSATSRIAGGRSGAYVGGYGNNQDERSEERRVGKECRSRWSPYH